MMSVVKRLNALLNANSHYMLDQAEQPDVMLAQLLRDVDDGIRCARNAVVQAVASATRIETELSEHQQKADAWRTRTENALKAGNEDAARRALERHIEVANTIAELHTARHNAAKLQDQLAGLRAKREGYLRRQAALVMRQRVAQANRVINRQKSVDVSLGDIDQSFTTLERRIADAEALNAAELEISARENETETLLSNVENKQAVDDAMSALKAKVATSA